jgi:predicted nucleic-acid-binding protein
MKNPDVVTMIENLTRIFSEKGKILLVLNNYTFYKDDITQGGIKWRCTLKSCTSKLFISENVLLKSVIKHKHSPHKHLTKVTRYS